MGFRHPEETFWHRTAGPGPNHSILMYCDDEEVSLLSPRWNHRAFGLCDWTKGQGGCTPLRGHHLWHVKQEGRWGQIEPNPDESGITNITLRYLGLFVDCIICELRGTCTGMLGVSVTDPEIALEQVNGIHDVTVLLVMKTLLKFLFIYLLGFREKMLTFVAFLLS